MRHLFFCAGETAFNDKIADILEDAGYDLFLPQRDGILGAELENKSPEEIVEIVFSKDVGELKSSDIVVFILDGRVPDEGACVELGIGYALGKRCYGIRTDARALEENMPLNPLIKGCFIKTFENYDEEKLFFDLREYLKNNKL